MTKGLTCVCLIMALAVSISRSSTISRTIWSDVNVERQIKKWSLDLSRRAMHSSRPPSMGLPHATMHAAHATPCSSYLFIQILKLAAGQFELCDLRQDRIPSAPIDVRDKALEAVDGVQGDLALVLDRVERVRQAVLFAELEDDLDDTAAGKGPSGRTPIDLSADVASLCRLDLQRHSVAD